MKTVSLGDVAEFAYGKALKAVDRDGGEYAVYGSSGRVGSHSAALTDGPSVVVGRKGSIGVVSWSDGPCWPIDTAYYVKPRRAGEYDPRWMYRLLGTLGLERLNKAAAVPGLNRDDAYRIEIALPTLPEQRHIAAILDHADVLRAERRQVLAHLDTLTWSIFHDMFGDGSALPQRRFRDVVARLEGGRSIVADDVSVVSRYRVLKISAVTTNHFQSSESKPLPAGYEPPAGHFVHKGDLLFSRANTTELVGAVALVEDVIKGLVLPDKLWRFVWREPDVTDAVYVWKLLQTRPMRRAISSRSSGTGGSMKNISKAKLQDMLVPWPSVDLQRKFAARVEEIGNRRVTMQRALAAGDELFASLQSRAIRGEL